MRKLLQFLYRNNHWFLFILLEVASAVLIFRFNSYQHSVYLTSANSVFGKAQEVSSSFTSYFHLKSINEELLDRNMDLEKRISILENVLRENKSQENEERLLQNSILSNYKLYPAHVVQNSIINVDNFILINKGAKDGIRPDMGVVNGNGAVGVVYKTSDHYSLVMSLLNVNGKFQLSCKILGSNYYGYFVWKYGNPNFAYLRDVPGHAIHTLGDTIVTNGFSGIFPEGVMVGTIDVDEDENDKLSGYLKIKLAVDFGKLDGVRVIENVDLLERRELEIR